MWYKMTEIHFRFPYFRLGLERGTTAKEALDVIVALLGEHGQGGNYYEDAGSCHSFQSAYLIVDGEEAWVLETVGRYWAAEKVTGECVWVLRGSEHRTGCSGCGLGLQDLCCCRRPSLCWFCGWHASRFCSSASREEPWLRTQSAEGC